MTLRPTGTTRRFTEPPGHVRCLRYGTVPAKPSESSLEVTEQQTREKSPRDDPICKPVFFPIRRCCDCHCEPGGKDHGQIGDGARHRSELPQHRVGAGYVKTG